MLIHTALMCEAQPIVEYFRLAKIEKNLFGNGEIFVFVGGVGAKTAQNLETILNRFEFIQILNVGAAGCSDSSIGVGELFCTNKKIDAIAFMPLVCVDSPQNQGYFEACLFDMESRYFLDVAKKFVSEENIFVFKVVSDHLDSKMLDKNFVSRLIKKQIPKWYEVI